ncbi:hypothetical protein GCM10020229_10030 [Kitasatospora albolonga]
MSVRVLLVDDEELLRLAFGMILRAEPDMEPVGEAADGQAAVELARRLRPDVVLMDVRMPGTDGIEATRQLLREVPGTRVLVLTTFDLDAYAFDALRAGASGFLLKNSRPQELLGAIRDVARGDAVVSPRVTRRLLDRFAHRLPVAGHDDGGRPERPARTDHARAGGPAGRRPWPDQHGTRRRPRSRRAHGEEAPRPGHGQAGPAGPGTGGDLRVRVRAGRTGVGPDGRPVGAGGPAEQGEPPRLSCR